MTNTGNFAYAPILNFDLNAAIFIDIIVNINISNYCEPPDLTHELNTRISKTSSLSILHINIRSLQKHINSYKNFYHIRTFFLT